MEIFSGSSRRKQYVSQAQLQRLAEGGRKADSIRKSSNNHHENYDISEANKLLEEAKKAYDEQKKQEKYLQKKEIKKQKSFWGKFIHFIKRIFYPA